MLLLSRRVRETIVIDPGGLNITLTIVHMNDQKVKIGVECPRSIAVHRGEVWQRIVEERRQAEGEGP